MVRIHRPGRWIARAGGAALACALGTVVFAGPPGAASPNAGQRETGALTYAFPDRALIPQLRACGRIFARTHPWIELRFQPAPSPASYTLWLRGQLAGARPPDAFAVEAASFPALVAAGALQPLEGLLSKKRLADPGYWPGLMKLWSGPDGLQLALPTTVDAVALAVHRGLVRGVVPWPA